MGRRWHELIVPALTLGVAMAYWLQVRGQARTVVLVPLGVIVLLAALCLAVVWRESRKAPDRAADRRTPQAAPGARSGSLPEQAAAWVKRHRREIGLVALCLGYYAAFQRLGFHIANLLFLWLAFPNSGLRWTQAIVYGTLTAVALYAVTELVQLNVPTVPWL
ncbi:MAG: tripartite tricarboxylate transporter TctB family protein [Firmicutes bacterium]|nr:tripartite tricarboxylate transporter TctB family protein [Bacillota bacterium]